MEIKLFSLVVPAYKAEKYIVKNIKLIQDVLENGGFKYEVIVVSDGSLDKTYREAKKIKDIRVRIFDYEKNQGKGFAVKYGMAKAKGDVVGFMDSGMDLDPTGILIAMDYMRLHDADIVVGSKLHPDSVIKYPLFRKLISFFTRWWTQFLFGFSVIDTQVGLKVFKGRVARDVFPRLLVKQFAFDIEILALASVLGYKNIIESPVKLKYRAGSISNKKLASVILLCFWDTLAIFYRIRILKYYRKSNKKNWLITE